MLGEPDVVEHTRSMLPFNDIAAPPAALPRSAPPVVDNPSFQAPLAADPPAALPATAVPHHQLRRLGPQNELATAASGAPAQRAESDMQLEFMSKILQQMETLNQTVSVMDRRLQLVEERMSYIEGSEQPE